MKKRILGLAVVLCLLLTISPTTALANGEGPTIFSAVVDSYCRVQLTFSEGVYADNSGTTGSAIVPSDFTLIFTSNGGLMTNATISSVRTNGNDDPVGGETQLLLYLLLNNPPSGVETIEIKPVADSIYNSVGVAMESTQTSGLLTFPKPVTKLEIPDAIAPINEGYRVKTITETNEYTGTIEWIGDGWSSPADLDGFLPFLHDTIYVATITLKPKEGYTFYGVTESAFSLTCAMSTTNPANSGVITATFISPPAEYITDGNGVMAYHPSSSFDIIGFFYNGWKQTTCGNGGYETGYKFNGEPTINIAATGNPIAMGETELTMDIDFAFVSSGRALQARYTVVNTGGSPVTGLSFGSHADTQIGNTDWAPISIFDNALSADQNRGFKMVSTNSSDKNDKNEYAQFNFFGKRSVGVTDVDTFWYGYYYDGLTNMFNQVSSTSYDQDSGIAYSWKNRAIGVGETQVYSVVIGIGGAESAGVLGYSVAYDDNVPSEVITVPDTQQKLENIALTLSAQVPVRSGFVFHRWNTQADGLGASYTPGVIYTLNSNLVLYAQWTESTQINGGKSSSIRYNITATAGVGGGILPAGSTPILKGSNKTFTITPESGYVISDVLVDGKSVGAVGSYTFDKVIGTHTIAAVFKIDTALDNVFNDVSSDDWFFGAVMHSHKRGQMLGTKTNIFSPYGNTTRVMVAAILHRMEKSPESTGGNIFTDVNLGLWYTDALMWTSQNGLVMGIGENLFAPNVDITREQFAAMLYRYARYKGYDLSGNGDLSGFMDADHISPYALSAIKWAVGSGMMKGKGGGMLDPKGKATRAEVATMLMSFL